ncbi:MAG: phosphoglucosamine mutase [Candidatus Aureabacteria bacterium]|nr:phosphoglucosamine mutase [Candidatus Auribacterota bacterium]
MKKLFGTDGIRGIANKEPMTVDTALKLGKAAAIVFRRDQRRHRIVIGKDTRISGYMYETALASGLCSMGVDVLLVGPLPTPGIAFITKSLRADAGIVLSASHNPYEDNGIKFFSHDGYKLPNRIEKEIENIVLNDKYEAPHVAPVEIGKAYRIDDATGRYIEYIKNSFPKGMQLEGIKVVIDCANGAAYKVAPTVMKELGADVIVTHDEPNGLNINKECGSTHPEKMAQKVKETGAHVGFAFDGDADRIIMADSNGKIYDGDYILAMSAIFLHQKKQLKNNRIITTVMSNMGLDFALSKYNIEMIRTEVGDRFVLEKMIEHDAVLGGEQSGHIIFRDFTTTGDGIITAMQILRILKESGKDLKTYSDCITKYPQYIKNIRVSKKIPFEKLPGVNKELEIINKKLKKDGRVLVRYSGTEPLIRIMVESRNEIDIDDFTFKLIENIQKEINNGGK